MSCLDRGAQSQNFLVKARKCFCANCQLVFHLRDSFGRLLRHIRTVIVECCLRPFGQIVDPRLQGLALRVFGPLALDQAGERRFRCAQRPFGLADFLVDQLDGKGVADTIRVASVLNIVVLHS